MYMYMYVVVVLWVNCDHMQCTLECCCIDSGLRVSFSSLIYHISQPGGMMKHGDHCQQSNTIDCHY